MIREPRPDDAPGINRLFIAIRPSITPNDPTLAEERIRWHEQHGVEKWQAKIHDARVQPDTYFMRIAALGSTIVGYITAEALPTQDYTLYSGLFVAPECQGNGLSAELEEPRLAWARSIGRPLRALIAPSNTPSLRFHLQQGFMPIGYGDTIAGTPPVIIMTKILNLPDTCFR